MPHFLVHFRMALPTLILSTAARWLFVLPTLLFFYANAQAEVLPASVQTALRNAQIPLENVAIVVQPVDAAAPLVSHQSEKAMNPASVMKLLTTYAALDLLGPAYTWQTTAHVDAVPVDGVLAGNLYLKGSGDPRLAIEHLWALLRQLRVRGIERIAGDIILDRSAFALPTLDFPPFDDKPMRPYNVGPNALLLNFQALRFTLRPEAGKPVILMETPSEGLRTENRLRLTDNSCGSDWKDQIETRLQSDANGQRLVFSGPYPSQCGEKALNLSPLSADAQADGLIRSLWRELGGTLAGRVRGGVMPSGLPSFARQESASLAEIVRDINKFSNNVMARQLFLSLGNDTAPASPERATRRLVEWLQSRNLRFNELVLENGSGLSRSERISAGNLNRLLLDAWKSPTMPEFIASMPIVGIDGTMKKRLVNASASGRAHIKTGTLDGVKTAAGYALDSQGRRHAVTFLINHPRAALGGPAIDALLQWIAQR